MSTPQIMLRKYKNTCEKKKNIYIYIGQFLLDFYVFFGNFKKDDMVNGHEGAWLLLRGSIGKCEQMAEVKARDDRMMGKVGSDDVFKWEHKFHALRSAS